MNTRILQRKLVRPFGFKWGSGTWQKIKAVKGYAVSSSVGAGICASSAVIAGYNHSMWTCAGLTCLTLLGIKLNKLARGHLCKLIKTSEFKTIAERFFKISNKKI